MQNSELKHHWETCMQRCSGAKRVIIYPLGDSLPFRTLIDPHRFSSLAPQSCRSWGMNVSMRDEDLLNWWFIRGQNRWFLTNMIDDLLFLSFVATLLAAGSRLGRTGSVPAPTSPFSACVQSRRQDGYYRGAIDVTESGHQCMNWTGVAGFRERYPRKGLGEHNQCRNPDGRIRPWCFFRNPRGRVDWGYCDCKQGRTDMQANRLQLLLENQDSAYEI